MKRSLRGVPPPKVVMFALLAGWILHPAFPAFGAPPVFDKPGYTYHPDVKKCEACHPADRKGFAVAHPVDALCHRCHDRKDAKKYVHGPLGSGECTSCHDPHGSPNRALAVASPEALCQACHDQASSRRHMKQSRGKGCVACHDPHSSGRNFLLK